MKNISHTIASLGLGKDVSDAELAGLLESSEHDSELFSAAEAVRRAHFGDAVYIRGLLEISSHCERGCHYCGLRKGGKATRYRLTAAQIMDCCDLGWQKGFRTVVLQAGEDPGLDDQFICGLLRAIKARHPEMAVTLSLGEREHDSYQSFFEAGADRYLLRHETASEEHYARLHPASMSLAKRKACLFDLKQIGFQVGAGFLVGSPWQTTDHLLADLRFLQELKPDMIGIGPFISHHDTPLRSFPNGSLDLTLRLLAILRLLFPKALLPATTALASLAPDGRLRGLKAGANVLMPNLSPPEFRKLYDLYDNKQSTGCESAEGMLDLERQVHAAGYAITIGRGDAPGKGIANARHVMA